MKKKPDITCLSFPKTIYPPKVVEKAARDYAEHAAVRVRKDASCTHVDFEGIAPEDKDAMTGEFGNYVLYLTKEVLPQT